MGRTKLNYNIQVPTSWDEVSLSTYLKIHKSYIENKNVNPSELISILANIPKEEVDRMPAIVVENIFGRLTFINEKIDETPSNTLEIDGEIYKVNSEEELKFKEYVDIQTMLDADELAYSQLLAILCRKEDEEYNDDFIETKLKERIEMFNNLPVTKVMHLIVFFLMKATKSTNILNQYSKEMAQLGINTLDNWESSLKNGDGKKSSLKSLMKKSQTLKKSLKSILQQF